MIGRFNTSSRQEYWGLELFAWALYKRGDLPTSEEYGELANRVAAKLPKAELVCMRRRFVPVAGGENPTHVTWEFKWIDFTTKESEATDGK